MLQPLQKRQSQHIHLKYTIIRTTVTKMHFLGQAFLGCWHSTWLLMSRMNENSRKRLVSNSEESLKFLLPEKVTMKWINEQANWPDSEALYFNHGA